jgi:hypothetical protein
MPQPPPRSPNDCFHCPQGDKPRPDTYRPGAWLARPSAEPAPAALDRRAGAGVLEASLQQTLRKLREAVASEGPRPTRLAADRKRGPFRRGG